MAKRSVLSDTVGFISDLPTMLVSAFRATLEEVIEADVVLTCGTFHTKTRKPKARTLRAFLHDLGIEAHDPRIIEVWNKVDLLGEDRALAMRNLASRSGVRAYAVSAITGESRRVA